MLVLLIRPSPTKTRSTCRPLLRWVALRPARLRRLRLARLRSLVTTGPQNGCSCMALRPAGPRTALFAPLRYAALPPYGRPVRSASVRSVRSPRVRASRPARLRLSADSIHTPPRIAPEPATPHPPPPEKEAEAAEATTLLLLLRLIVSRLSPPLPPPPPIDTTPRTC